ncbi:MAG: 3-oxoacyl-ACP synthase III family protein [Bacteroidia bacterium]
MKINILSLSKYLPKNRIASESMDSIAKGAIGRIEKNTGVKLRYHVSGEESVCQMGAEALSAALEKAQISIASLDLLIFSGTSFDYPVPHNAVIIKSKLADDSINFPCFDVDSTCLSFLNALDIAHLYLQAGRYKRIAIVCSEIASKALTPKDEKVFGLFGDAAVAIILEASESKGYTPIYTHFQNFPSGALYAYVPIGGAINRGFEASPEDIGYHFKMEGKKLIRLTTQCIAGFIHEIEQKTGIKITDFDKIITHQTSKYGNEFFLKHFKINPEKVVETLPFYGNCISASIPLGLEYLYHQDFDFTGKKILLLGSGAGLTIGGAVLVF